MSYRTKHTVVTAVLVVLTAMAVPAQQATNPLEGVWLLSFKPVPLAMLLAFREDTYSVIGRISYHGSNIYYTTLDEDKGPRQYALQDLEIEGPILQFKISLEGVSYEAMGPLPGTTTIPMPLFLFSAGEILAELRPIPELQYAPMGVAPHSAN